MAFENLEAQVPVKDLAATTRDVIGNKNARLKDGWIYVAFNRKSATGGLKLDDGSSLHAGYVLDLFKRHNKDGSAVAATLREKFPEAECPVAERNLLVIGFPARNVQDCTIQSGKEHLDAVRRDDGTFLVKMSHDTKTGENPFAQLFTRQPT